MAKEMRFRGWHQRALKYAFAITPQSIQGEKIRIAFNIHPKQTPFGGANEFVKQIAVFSAWSSWEIVYDLDPLVTHIFILDVRRIENCTFGLEEIRRFKKKFPKVCVIHRVNNCDQKYTSNQLSGGDHEVDSKILSVGEFSDTTVFISEWLKEYFLEKGFDSNRSHCVVTNAAYSDLFYPGSIPWNGKDDFKIVTHHWSDNWLKGFKIYQEIDEMIASKELGGFELTVIGRWPKEIVWKSAKTMGPMVGMELADELRRHHLYVTASQYEPGGMHFIEGMQCGLPVVFQKNGGGICEVARRAGIEFDTDVKAALLQAKAQYAELREKVLRDAPSGKKLCEEFYKIIGG